MRIRITVDLDGDMRDATLVHGALVEIIETVLTLIPVETNVTSQIVDTGQAVLSHRAADE